ncbi:MAG TPA: redoxin domain-containing protein [Steroidobacteraceae bacterium]|nr:redoxin domain-containing protein [Steroidobacteraceae bacterium]
MKTVARVWITILAGVALAVVASMQPWQRSTARAASDRPAPELPELPASAWLNSSPLTLAEQRGRPVLVEFWTFGCSNCRATLPWLKRVHERYAPQGLQVISIHSPEFEHERDPTAVARHVRQFGIRYPVLIDNEFRYWKALDNRFWPAFFLIDPQGRLVDRRIGELHPGERSADAFERRIASYLPGDANHSGK